MIATTLSALIFALLAMRCQSALARVALPRGDARARQSSHVGEPPRIGGLAVVGGLMVGVALWDFRSAGDFAAMWLLSAVPVLLAGLAEDLGRRVSPAGRLVAAMLASFAAIALLGAWSPRTDVPLLDAAMRWPAVAIAVTVFFAGVFCHAVNLIDGMNGLAATVIATSALGMAAVAAQTGESGIMTAALLLSAATAGFLFVNWPTAHMFLGDAGAYGLGHLLVWLGILLVASSAEVAVPALMLVIFWPLADVLHTVLRRLADRAPVLMPDRMHLHQKLRRTLDIMHFGYNGRWRSNPLTTFLLVPFILPPVATGVWLWDRPLAAWIAFGLFFVLFSAAHRVVAWLARSYRR